jgi:hypothetical protein
MEGSEMPSILASEAVRFMRTGHKGRIFGVLFIKRTNGELRRMSCRQGVTSGLTGGGRAYEFEAYDLTGVYDMHLKLYRVVPTEGLLTITINKVLYDVVQDPKREPQDPKREPQDPKGGV